ncbi:CGNR zinc finger domain-containing protein [Microtetraspora sp. NBRC 13810]|uniref:CGNR zinc finger domain-containing protein n=1 Tax=Microtetraspora sp. NBRC 13810 TaxID=3030990 RepID=UPI00255652C9|nr:CGNR zinc finger domain-containing protein [Microtetraspora sp. NBRC 13810]
MSSDGTAPGGLEVVRAFLNTWEIPNDTRVPVDRLDALAAVPARWEEALPGLPAPAPESVDDLRRLRAGLREQLGRTHPAGLAAHLDRHPLVVTLGAAPPEPPVRLRPATPGTAGVLLAHAVGAIGDGLWHRLKACPDCRWVFYDTTRNAGRVWCAMTADGPGRRGCGAIAKTRAHRARARAAHWEATS